MADRHLDRRGFVVAGIGATAAIIGFNRIARAQLTDELFTQMVHFRAQAGKEEQATQLLMELAAAHEQSSQNCLMFHALRGTTDPLEFLAYEVFTTGQAAIDANREEHLVAFFPRYNEVFDNTTRRNQLARIAAFSR